MSRSRATDERGALVGDVVVVHDLGCDATEWVALAQQLQEAGLELLRVTLDHSLRVLRWTASAPEEAQRAAGCHAKLMPSPSTTVREKGIWKPSLTQGTYDKGV